MNRFTLQKKLLLSFVATTVIILLVNIFMYYNVNQMVKRLDDIYLSNVALNDLSHALGDVQTSMTDYLNTKSSDSLEAYFRAEQDYSALIQELENEVSSNQLLLMEKNIRNMSIDYMDYTNQTVEAKRGRNIEKYKIRYEKASELYEYIGTYIYSLNNEQFMENTGNYKSLSISLQYVEYVSLFILLTIALCNIVLITLLTKSITRPIGVLAETANQVAKGNLDVELVEAASNDEIGVVSSAFNQMVASLKEYIAQIKASMEKEGAMKEKELMMETHLKDAQLKYLQAQINPHFLFNTLNAGAQLAMMEEADKTYEYVQRVADFYRYNMNKNNAPVSIADEIALVDNYIYILNVRFSGDIHYEKRVENQLLKMSIPSMILQPIVENCVNYGIRDISWQGRIILSVYQEEDTICISIQDNGIGMTQEKIDKIMHSRLKEADLTKDSNGIGMDNVIGRLRLFFDYEDVLEIHSNGENQGTEVIIYIPLDLNEYEDRE